MSRTRLAAEYRRKTGCSIKEAAERFGVTSSPVSREYKRMYEGVKRDRSKEYAARRYVPKAREASPQRLSVAVDFMIKYGTTTRRAADAFGVPADELLAAYNLRTGGNRQMVG